MKDHEKKESANSTSIPEAENEMSEDNHNGFPQNVANGEDLNSTNEKVYDGVSAPDEEFDTDGPVMENISSEHLSSRYLPQVPYQYKPTLIQYNDNEVCTDYHFGLIRGYHREMYDQRKHKFCCPCTWDRHTHIAVRNRVFTKQVMGVFLGSVFVFLGLAILLVSFAVLSDEAKEYFWKSLNVPSQYIHIFMIAGLGLLTLGTAMVSLFLLVPLCVGQTHPQNSAKYWCTAGDLYIKNAEKAYNLAPNQFLYFDADFYRKVFGTSEVKRVQPEVTSE